MVNMSLKSLIALSAAAPLVAAHGYWQNPVGRVAGEQFKANCGQQIYNNLASDNGGNIQTLENLKQSDFTPACKLEQCRGFTYEDSKANVQTWSVGQNIPLQYNIRAPHTGSAKVSIIDLSTGATIGQPLLTWDVYASTATGVKPTDTSFNVTIPDLGGKCTAGGECALQHWWDAPAPVNQTYPSCIDFVVAGSGTGAGAPAAPAPSASPSVSAAAAAPSTADAGDGNDGGAKPSVTPAVSSAPAPTTTQPPAGSGDGDACPAPVVVTVPTAAPSAAPGSGAGGGSPGSATAAALYEQCGGMNWTGPTTCSEGTCTVSNDYYSQCI